MHHHGVHGAFNTGKQAFGRHQRGVYAQLNAFTGFFLCIGLPTLCNTQQLDAVTQLLSVFDVLRAKPGDAFNIGLVKLHRHAKGDGRHQADFVRGVYAFNVKSWVGFGIAQRLRLLKHHVKIKRLVTHLAQNKIGSAVDDAGYPFNLVCTQAFTQRLDDGNTARHCRLKRNHHTFFVSGCKNFATVYSKQCLVGGNHMLAHSNRL